MSLVEKYLNEKITFKQAWKEASEEVKDLYSIYSDWIDFDNKFLDRVRKAYLGNKFNQRNYKKEADKLDKLFSQVDKIVGNVYRTEREKESTGVSVGPNSGDDRHRTDFGSPKDSIGA